MGNFVSGEKGFHWEYTETPHLNRRLEMLKKHPELKQLMKSNGDRLTVIYGFASVVAQFGLAYTCSHLSFTPASIFLSMTLGSWIVTGIFLHIHECSHGLTFGPNSLLKNRLYGLSMNLPLVFPIFETFKRHHRRHHKFQGETDLDVEYPIESELAVFRGPFGKYVWVLLNPTLQLWRALKSEAHQRLFGPNVPNAEEYVNITIQILFMIIMVATDHFYMLFLLLLSNLTAMSTMFIGFWNVTSHTEFFHGEETRNFHGWLNNLYLNFGYHIEHHDFPNVPSRLLPKIRKIAPEFYTDDYVMDSLLVPTVVFINNPKFGLFSHVKRITR